MAEFVPSAAQAMGLSLLAGAAFGLVSACAETATFHALAALHAAGCLPRLAGGTGTTHARTEAAGTTAAAASILPSSSSCPAVAVCTRHSSSFSPAARQLHRDPQRATQQSTTAPSSTAATLVGGASSKRLHVTGPGREGLPEPEHCTRGTSQAPGIYEELQNSCDAHSPSLAQQQAHSSTAAWKLLRPCVPPAAPNDGTAPSQPMQPQPAARQGAQPALTAPTAYSTARAAHTAHTARTARTARTTFSPHTLLVFQISVTPAVFLALLMWHDLEATMKLEARPLAVLLFVVPALVLHDAWFFAGHTLLHRSKGLYCSIHLTHHRVEGSTLNVFATAAMEPLEACLLFMLPYLLLLLGCHHLTETWNPVAIVALVALEASMNMAGHSGYDLPLWLHLLFTGGLGVLPWSATSRSHYMHHQDPRCNRGLYFTWWDIAAGTFRR